MIGLPAALAPWAGLLSLFPEDLALGLGPWVQRLSLALGPLRARTHEGRSEPDGYHGLARRGPYERLLSSEWLLAGELPEEFTRRAAMGEHAFLELAFQEPAGSRRAVALFDAGPSQLGTPRLAHLAALIVLAQRAERAGAGFAWGFLQHPDVGLIPEVTPTTVLRLLHARTAVEVREKQLSAWQDVMELPRAPDDLWLVGSTRLASLPGALAASSIEVRDVLDPVARQLGVTVRRARTPATPLTLELPPPNACTRLLRDPFAVITPLAKVQDPDPGQPLQILFSGNGRRLITRLMDGSVAAHPVPNSPRATVGRPRRFSPPTGERIVAVGWEKRLLALTWREGPQLLVHGFSPNAWEVTFPWGVAFRPPAPGAPVGPCYRVFLPRGPRVVFGDAARNLYELQVQGRPLAALVAGGVDLFVPRPGGLWYVGGHALMEMQQGTRMILALNGEAEAPFEVFYGSGLLAARLGIERWVIRGGDHSIEVAAPPEGNVVGVARGNGRVEESAGLLVLDPDRRTLWLVGRAFRRKVTSAPAEVLQVCASPGFGELAFLTVRGEVEVFSLSHGAPVLRLAPGSSSAVNVDGGSP